MINRLDSFKLVTYQNIDVDERNVVTLLYQPLIGTKAYSLYMVLWSLIDRARLRTPNYNHDKLYDLLDLSPDTFTTVRKKLEAIGLITVYQNEEQYLYELKAPLSAEEFIKDGSLGAYLFSKIGKINFDELVGLFRVSTIEKDGFKIDRKVEMLLSSDTPNATTKSVGLGTIVTSGTGSTINKTLAYFSKLDIAFNGTGTTLVGIPLTFNTSSTRPITQMYPSSSSRAPSAVK